MCFNTMGNQIVTGAFDHTVAVWDVAAGRSDNHYCNVHNENCAVKSFLFTATFSIFLSRVHTLTGHRGEISNVQFNWDCSLIVTGSMDKTCKVNYLTVVNVYCLFVCLTFFKHS